MAIDGGGDFIPARGGNEVERLFFSCGDGGDHTHIPCSSLKPPDPSAGGIFLLVVKGVGGLSFHLIQGSPEGRRSRKGEEEDGGRRSGRPPEDKEDRRGSVRLRERSEMGELLGQCPHPAGQGR